MARLFKNTGVELGLLTNNDMLMIIEKGTRGGICHAIYIYIYIYIYISKKKKKIYKK